MSAADRLPPPLVSRGECDVPHGTLGDCIRCCPCVSCGLGRSEANAARLAEIDRRADAFLDSVESEARPTRARLTAAFMVRRVVYGIPDEDET